ncbi:MAG: GNAT family N-acetyltransferase [Clostridia bacterium]|nr:GNAT family N-acetyltransferase [Clostridia bacterium]
MAQLIMNWHNDGTVPVFPVFPEGVSLKRLPDLTDGPTQWLDIIRFMEQKEKTEVPYEVFEKSLLKHLDFDENLCFFLAVKGEIAATITVICHREQRQGYIHMVACKPSFRGMGLGHLLNDVAVYTLKQEGMKTAYLTTDDWRLAAIKTYLKAGFVPDKESNPDFAERWKDVAAALNLKNQ